MRTAVNPGDMVRPVREAIESGGEAGVQEILPVSEVLKVALLRQTFARRMLGVLAGIGFLLSLAGLSALAACAVSQRQREAGIRMALGARGWEVGVAVLSQPLLAGTVGIAAGAGLGAALSRAVGGILFGVAAMDPWIYVAVPGVTLGAMLVAAALQMRRITSVPVSDLLRSW
jgi:ABC-type antimicrobial peptide transport system permease subunit